MTIIATTSLVFHGQNGQHLSVGPASKPQQVAEWVRDTDTFKMAVKGGKLAEINYATAPLPDESAANAAALGLGASVIAPADTTDAAAPAIGAKSGKTSK